MQEVNQKLILRVDAATQTGSGHILRCLALAQAWKDHGGRVAFLSHCEDTSIRARVEKEGMEFIFLEKPHPDPQDLKYTLVTLEQLRTPSSSLPPWCVLDGYPFDPIYQEAIRDSGYRLLVIDDLNHHPCYPTDLLLNQNMHSKELAYQCGAGTKLLMGPEYALLRKEFWRWRGWRRKNAEVARKVLVAMGGSDTKNLTFRVIKALKRINIPDMEISVVIGPMNRHRGQIENELRFSPFRFRLCSNPRNMPLIMAWADVAISAGGSTCFELAFMGLPNMIIVSAENQRRNAEALDIEGVAVNQGWHEEVTEDQMVRTLHRMMLDQEMRIRISGRGQELVDGRGGELVISSMILYQIKLRRAEEGDCELIWKWANDPTARKSAFNSEPIEWEEHRNWFLEKLNNPRCFQYVALGREGIPIGQVRFDIINSMAEVDYSIDRHYRGHGLGIFVLRKGIERLYSEIKKPLTILGRVKKENDRSNRIFLRLGFSRIREPLEKSNVKQRGGAERAETRAEGNVYQLSGLGERAGDCLKGVSEGTVIESSWRDVHE